MPPKKFIEIDYNRELQPLEAILANVKQPGDFYCAGTVEIPMPRVEVKGAGALSFPIPVSQIAAIVREATQAPYGRGEETIVDTAVRNVWQIAPGAVKISGKSWAASFAGILAQVTAGLGCQKAAVSAELYKMLVYESGGFFLAHRDTEKAAGMFGTLVVTLPSAYRGGALRIRHAEREVTVEGDATEPSEVSFAAFYCDCEHEVLSVREGSRVCLVYNLIQDRTKGRQRLLKAPEYGAEVAKTAAVLEEYWQSPEATPKVAWLLEHQYSPADISFATLKGADEARSRVLAQAAAQARCIVHLGVVHIGENGAAELEYDSYSRSRRNRYGGYFEDGEDEEDAAFTAVTVDEQWRYLDEWRDTEDRVVEFGRIPLAEGELLPGGALDGEPPDEKRVTEATGNEGATYERSYHRAALVVWPENRVIDVLLEAGVVATLPHLQKLVAGGESTRPLAMAAAQRVVEAWLTKGRGQSSYFAGMATPKSSGRATMIGRLAALRAPGLLERFIREAVTPAYDGSENTALTVAAGGLEEATAGDVFSALVEARMAKRPTECAELLRMLAGGARPAFSQIAEASVAGLDDVGTAKAEDPSERWGVADGQRRRPMAPEFLVNLFSGLQHFQNGTLCGEAAGKIVARPKVFDAVTLIVPAIESLRAEGAPLLPAVEEAIELLWTGAAEFLLGRNESAPQPPNDWSQHAEISCKCTECRELQAFARNPAEQAHRFRVNKDRRGHLHRAIDEHKLSMTHVTERKGSPQTLVCTKDRRDYVARMKEYRSEIAAMGKLVELAHRTKAVGELSRRMEAAIRASAT